MPRRQPTATARSLTRAERRHRTIAILLSLVVIVAVVAPATARAQAGWRLPVDGAVVGGFRVTPGAPFAAGQRRGIDLLARPGAAVRAACSGRVTFAGQAPDARAVTVRCAGSPYLATHVGLGAITVRRGMAVVRGMQVGTAGARGLVRLGARRADDRRRYADPRGLLEETGGRPTAIPPVAPLAPRGGGRRPGPPPIPFPRPVAAARPAAAPTAPAVPLLAWIGLVLVLAGAPASLLMAGRRQRRDRTRTRTAPARIR